MAVIAGALAIPHISYISVLPELIAMGAPMVMLLWSATTRSGGPGRWTAFTVVASVAAFLASVEIWVKVGTHPYTAVAGAILVDRFSAFLSGIFAVAMGLFALLAHDWAVREDESGPELPALGMLSASGAMLMAAAGDLVVVFLGLEIMSIALYVMAAMNRRRLASGEAALKYFVLGAFSSAIFLYGIALTYGATGTTNIARIASYLASNVVVSNGVLLAGMAMLIVGLGFKVAAVPFHTWSPDVYQGSPSPVTAFMSAVAKAAGFAALVRVLMEAMGTLRLDWQPAIYVLAVLSLVVGGILTVVQRDVKRMLAYSSISHAGFVLAALQSASAAGRSALAYYVAAYTLMIIGSFAVAGHVGGPGDRSQDLSSYRGLSSRHPAVGFAFTILLLGQAGAPFTTGFLAKFYVVSAAVGNGSYTLAVVAMLSAVVTAFFYLRIVLGLYGSEEPSTPEGPPGVLEPQPALVGSVGEPQASHGAEERGSVVVPEVLVAASATQVIEVSEVGAGTSVVLALCAAATVVLGVWPSPLLDLAKAATIIF